MRHETVFNDFDRLFDGMARGFWSPVVRGETVGASTLGTSATAYDVAESEQGYLLSLDVPGIPNDQIKIEVKDRELRISGERKKSGVEAEDSSSFTGRRYGKFERVFALPTDVDVDKIQARQEHGVLELMLPKVEKPQAKTIKIETGSGEGFFSKLIGKREDA